MIITSAYLSPTDVCPKNGRFLFPPTTQLMVLMFPGVYDKIHYGDRTTAKSPKNSENHVKSPKKTVKNHVKLAKKSVKTRYFALHQWVPIKFMTMRTAAVPPRILNKKIFFLYISIGVHRTGKFNCIKNFCMALSNLFVFLYMYVC